MLLREPFLKIDSGLLAFILLNIEARPPRIQVGDHARLLGLLRRLDILLALGLSVSGEELLVKLVAIAQVVGIEMLREARPQELAEKSLI